MKTIKQNFDLKAATSFVVSSMIGVGVFTSLGYQLASTDTTFSIMLLWLLGGVGALTGALSYVALALVMPRSGGEYHFLSQIYGPAVGYATGILTVVVGFAAPIAASAMAFESYAENLFELPLLFWALGCLVLTTSIHLFDVKKGGEFNFLFTALKVVMILIFILVGLFFAEKQTISLVPQIRDWDLIWSSGFGVSLVYVTYSYTGWNAAVYVLDEVKNPLKNVPLAILIGTFSVMLIYTVLHLIFLWTTPQSALLGQIDVAHIVGQYIFGEKGALLVSGLIAFGLISTISSMIVSGSRVMKRMGEDHRLLSVFGQQNKKGVPHWALLLVFGLSLMFVLTFTFEQVIEYAGFILSFFGLFTVIGLFILKIKKPNLKMPFGKWFFPIVPLIYLLIKVLIITYLLIDDPWRLMHGALTFGLAFGIYGLNLLVEKHTDNGLQ